MILLDIATLRWVAVVLYAVFALLITLVGLKNKDIRGWRLWVVFALLIAFEGLLSLDERLRHYPIVLYIANIITVSAYLSLLLGCMQFTRLKVNAKWVLGFIAFLLLVNTAAYIGEMSRMIRIWVNIFLIVGTLIGSIFVIHQWNRQNKSLEKSFLLFWMTMQLVAFVIRVYFALNLEPELAAILNSWTLLFLISSNAFIIMGLHFMVTAYRQVQLEKEARARLIAEQQALRAMRAADIANETKTRFLANMSHEFRTPLNAVLGFSETMYNETAGPITDQQREYLTYILDSGDTLLRLVNDVLDFASIEVSELTLKEEDVDLLYAIDRTIGNFKLLAEKRAITLSFECPKQQPAHILGDLVRVKQVISNLISNAIKYGNEGGRVDISIKTDAEDWIVCVNDTGRGISDQQKDQIFKPFNRAGLEALSEDGTGLGLAITRYLVHAMKGTIGFDSEVGVGSTFWVRFKAIE